MSGIACKLGLVDNWTGDLSLLGFVVSFVATVIAVSLVVSLAIIFGGRAYGRTTCTNWSAQTGIATKFVVLNWADSGNCLARTPDGRWVSNDKWQAFVPAGK